MRKYQLDDSKMEFRPQGPYYIAAEVDARIAELEKALREAKRSHYACEDPWYQCPMHPEGCANEFEPKACNCGTDEFNAKIDAVLSSAL